MTERVLNPNSKEDENLYIRMEAVASILTAYSPNNAIYKVENVYLDYGQRWMWTTICRYRFRECQILCPRDWQNIMEADTKEKLYKVIEEIINDKYFGDKVKGEEKW